MIRNQLAALKLICRSVRRVETYMPTVRAIQPKAIRFRAGTLVVSRPTKGSVHSMTTAPAERTNPAVSAV